MRTRKGALVALLAAALVLPSQTAGADSGRSGRESGGQAATSSETAEFVVFYAGGATAADAHAAIAAAGGRVVEEIAGAGVARVATDRADFARVAQADAAIAGVTRNHSVGTATPGRPHRFAEERALEDRRQYAPAGDAAGDGADAQQPAAGSETFSSLQWDMAMIGATPEGAHQQATGEGVVVGIIDTGIDASHPDIAPNFDAALSRNFTHDIEAIDGPCAAEPDQSCDDPANVDEGGHGTHVAGTVAAVANGLGIAGVAPDATLVNLRAGQDSGYFFLFETLSALYFAADNGIDVVNMSFYTDPWLYNCDSRNDYVEGTVTATELAEQRTIKHEILEAVDTAYAAGVTLVAAAGNQHADLAAPTREDATSPDYPPGIERARVVTNDCLDLPSEAPGVIQVSSIGPSTVKADYSTWGLGSIDVAAPGGWFRDGFGSNDFREPDNMILSTYPASVATEEGAVNPGGGLRDPHFYKRDCSAGSCAYYQYLQGTSMASPHVTGIVALIIEAHGLDGDPARVYDILTSTATDTPCPDPALLDYTQEGRPASWNATCEGDAEFNSNYGHGIVNAAAAVATP